MKTYVHTKTYARIFIVVLFIITKRWKQPKCPLMEKWVNKIGIIQKYIIQPLKGRDSDICCKMDEPWGQDTK